jgi:arginine/ornithine N-succinyltransferase beta subunit
MDLQNFRAVRALVVIDDDEALLGPDTADVLRVKNADLVQVRV